MLLIINFKINISFNINYNKYIKGIISLMWIITLQIRNIWKIAKESIK